jgi:hypothetical protein
VIERVVEGDVLVMVSVLDEEASVEEILVLRGTFVVEIVVDKQL